MKKKPKMVTITIELEDDVYNSLVCMAKGRGMKVEDLVVEILTNYVMARQYPTEFVYVPDHGVKSKRRKK